MATRFTKADIQFHGLGTGYTMVPAVNVKIHNWDHSPELYARVGADHGGADGAGFTRAWVEAHLDDRARDAWWAAACENGWEQLNEDVNAEDVFGRTVEVYSEGRSGGWAYVDYPRETARTYYGHLFTKDDALTWDAIAVARWGKFVRFARETVADVPYQYLSLIYLNVYEPWYTDQTENEPARQLLRAKYAELAAEAAPDDVTARGALAVLRRAEGRLTP